MSLPWYGFASITEEGLRQAAVNPEGYQGAQPFLLRALRRVYPSFLPLTVLRRVYLRGHSDLAASFWSDRLRDAIDYCEEVGYINVVDADSM